MPYDLEAVERGYGECSAPFNGHDITLRYRVDLDGRAMIALKRAAAGVPVMGIANARIPDTEMVISELIRVLLPCTEDTPERERGWDITRGGRVVPITEDELMKLDVGLPVALLMAVLADVNNPNRRRLSLNGSGARADSPQTASPTTTGSSATPNGQGYPSGLSLVSGTTPSSGLAGAAGFGA
jgi:hypothetical protein